MLNKEDIELLNSLTIALKKRYPEWRKGQTLFNAVYMLFPYVADSFRGGCYDPFYDDNKIDIFITALQEEC